MSHSAEAFLSSETTLVPYPGAASTNGTSAEWCTFPDLFEKTASHCADAVAASFNDVSVTYAELNCRANQIANYLRSAGVGSESLVGVCLERSLDSLSTLLGILKSGAAYLPIDIALPSERIRFMMEDASVSLVITQHSLAAKIPLLDACSVDLESIFNDESASRENPDPVAQPGDLAYVIYTSGSTGKPKGVEILHRSLMNFLSFMQGDIAFTANDVMLAHSSISFDISVFELFLPLVSGGRVVIVGSSVAVQGDSLRDTLARAGITAMLATPTTWQLLLGCGWPGDKRLKCISGGEIITPLLADALRERTSSVWNHYGPTETTICASTYRIAGGEERVPIGRGVSGFEMLILDEKLQPVSPGLAGELFIAGEGLARGYRNRPDLTAQRFIKVRTGDGAFRRAYRTGDLVRQLEDGNIDYVGRVDNQVKIRGFRIELEEIESVLALYPGITENAVVARDFPPDGKRLIAYYTTSQPEGLRDSEIRFFLRNHLPSHMVPSAFVRLPQLPTMISGKVDRQALMEQPNPILELDTIPAGKQDVVEAELLSIWRRVMAPQPVQPADNFFEIGGHSILAARLVQEVEDRFGTRLPLSVLLEAPTVRDIAALIRDTGWAPSWSPLVPIRPVGRLAPLFCLHPIGGNVIGYQSLSKHVGANQPLYGIQARGLDRAELPHMSVEAMAADYIQIVRKVQPRGPYLLAGYSAGGIVAFEMTRQLRQIGESVALLALFDAYIGQRVPQGELRSAEPHHGREEEAPASPGKKPKGPIATFVARVRHFRAMAAEDKLASLQRNTIYWKKIVTMEFRIRRYLMLQKVKIRVAPLRLVDDAFGLAVRVYKPEPLDVNTILFRAAKSDGDHDPDPAMGWRRLIVGPFEIRNIAGDHFTILYEPYVEALGQSLAAAIPDAMERAKAARAS